jgi:hypothetical protein
MVVLKVSWCGITQHRARRAHGRGLDEGFLSSCLSILVYMGNPCW